MIVSLAITRLVSTRFAPVLLLALACTGVRAATPTADSRAAFVHRINLYAHDGSLITAASPRPWSPGITCGKCHDYATIASGYHFDAGTSGSLAGRPGEPWILADAKTGSQIPLSQRGWTGTYKPEQIGLSNWEFVKAFGRHMPGGGVGDHTLVNVGEGAAAEPEEDADLFDLSGFVEDSAPAAAASGPGGSTAAGGEAGNWKKAGNLEIDCMACHTESPRLNQAERATQIEDDNFRFVPTATSGLGVVRGSTRRMPANAGPSDPSAPKVLYNAAAFDADDRVFMDVRRSPGNQSCYFCHTTNSAPGDPRLANWERDTDVHLTSGMDCTDCHRHGLDHQITRGYAGEAATRAHSAARTLTCAGCHYGTGPDIEIPEPRGFQDEPLGGRLGSPIWDHPGLPPVHFDKLTCTACHSGPYPGEQSRLVMTSLAHGLGLSSEHRTIARPPYVEQPVFVLNDEGKIEPRKAVWPAFWATFQTQGSSETLTPLKPEDAARAGGAAFRNGGRESDAFTPLNDDDITAALKALAGNALLGGGEAAYVAAGRLHTLAADGTLQRAEHAAAEPYTWPIGHDVRPAGQSLGARGCADCHAQETAIFYGKTLPGAPVALAAAGPRMYELRGEDPFFLRAWEASFGMRLALKIVGFTACAVLGLLLLAHGVRALAGAGSGASGAPRGGGPLA